MKQLTFTLLLFHSICVGQIENKRNCKIEFYFLKSGQFKADTSIRAGADSLPITIVDLADTAFIKNEEITNFRVKSRHLKFADTIFTIESLWFELVANTTNKMRSLKIHAARGTPFALLVNGIIIYSGYFWRRDAEWSEPLTGAIAYTYDTNIDIFLRELPKSPILLNCLNETQHQHLVLPP